MAKAGSTLIPFIKSPVMVGGSEQPMDPYYRPKGVNVLGNLGDTSTKFTQDLPAMKRRLYESAAGQSKADLADSQRQIRSDANARGLLHSGIRQGRETEAAAAAAGQLANQTFLTNQALEQQANMYNKDYLDALLDEYRSDVAAEMGRRGVAQQRFQTDQQNRQSLFSGLGGLAGAGAALMAGSDENFKENIKDASSDESVDELLEAIQPKTYTYKKEMNESKEKHLSPMAQDLEKSEIGKSMVIDTPHGKLVDYAKASGAILAIQAALDKRLKALEERAR